jgi:hypothetical protein
MRIRPALLSLALAAGALWPAAVTAPAACAGESPRAALVVDTGEAVLNFCVTLPDDSVSGIELVKLASQQHDLSYKLGFGGAAVCHLAGVGPTGDDCFEQDPDFWGYWRGNGSGGWTWASTGAGSTTVTDGSVEGWAWGSGTGPDTHPAPPTTHFADVCAPLQASESKGGKRSEHESGESQEPVPAPSAGATAEGDGGSADKRAGGIGQKKDGPRKNPEPRPSPSAAPAPSPSPPSPTAAALGPSELASDSDGAGPPGAGIAALLATVALVGGGALAARRRRRAE